MANLVLPQVSRTFRRLIPGYKETYEAHVEEFERREGEWVVFKNCDLHMLLLNTSPSISRWLLDDAHVDSDENRSALDRYIQSGKQEDMPRWYRCECKKTNTDCAGKCCVGCAVFCANAEHTGYSHNVLGPSIRGACPACAPSMMTKCACCNDLCCNMCMRTQWEKCHNSRAARSHHVGNVTETSVNDVADRRHVLWHAGAADNIISNFAQK